ncbi:glycosyltransferase family 4 protein, partial [bacterium]|nr:glycosyltransferase family 4 protein [bacterium]
INFVHILLIFTYNVSLADWKETGILDREIRLYKKLNDLYGVKFTFLTFGDDTDLSIDIPYKFINILPIYSVVKQKKGKLTKLLSSFMIPFQIRSLIDNPDVVKTNQLLGSWIAITMKIFYRCPIVIRTGYNILEFSIKNKKNVLKIIFYYFLTMVSVIMSDLYTVTSKKDSEFIKKYIKVKGNGIVIKPNWVDINESVKYVRSKKINDIICVGRLEEQKNFGYLIESFSNSKTTLNIVGKGRLREALQKKAVQNNTNVNFINPVKNEELLELMSTFKFFILPSRFEGSPKAVLEAMSVGCIVIANDLPEIREIIENNWNGLITPAIENNFRLAFENISKDSDKQKQLSQQAFKTISESYSLEKYAQQEYSEFKNLIRN